MQNKDLLEVIELFNNENDEKALTKLYELTEDRIVQIALKWNEEYNESMESVFSDASYMYNDIISYIYEKYELDKVTEKDEDKDIEY